MLKLLGFFEELGYTGVLVNGSLLMQVQPVGEPDEARIVEYLDVGHRITAVMEAGVDVLTGSVHRHTSGCSSLVTDGEWTVAGRLRALPGDVPRAPARSFHRTGPRALSSDAGPGQCGLRSALQRDTAEPWVGLGRSLGRCAGSSPPPAASRTHSGGVRGTGSPRAADRPLGKITAKASAAQGIAPCSKGGRARRSMRSRGVASGAGYGRHHDTDS